MYEEKVCRIDTGSDKIDTFDKDTLFLNIYHFWCFTNYVLMYYLWRWTALDRLEMNLRKKWPKNFVNVNLFIELCERKTELISPVVFYGDDESYFDVLTMVKKVF